MALVVTKAVLLSLHCTGCRSTATRCVVLRQVAVLPAGTSPGFKKTCGAIERL